MGKAFKKGQKVTFIWNWDSKGTVYVRQATVHSCGTQQLKLTCDLTGEEFGHNLRPEVAAAGKKGTRPRIEGEALAAEATAVAVSILEEQRLHFQFCLSQTGTGEGYRKHIQRDLGLLHEPRVLTHAEAQESVRVTVS